MPYIKSIYWIYLGDVMSLIIVLLLLMMAKKKYLYRILGIWAMNICYIAVKIISGVLSVAF